jgi:hypothetical protein
MEGETWLIKYETEVLHPLEPVSVSDGAESGECGTYICLIKIRFTEYAVWESALVYMRIHLVARIVFELNVVQSFGNLKCTRKMVSVCNTICFYFRSL